jgi:hypothetical protein
MTVKKKSKANAPVRGNRTPEQKADAAAYWDLHERVERLSDQAAAIRPLAKFIDDAAYLMEEQLQKLRDQPRT